MFDAQILFKTDSRGRANAIVLRQMGLDKMAVRIDGDVDPPEEWFGHREAVVNPAVYSNYVGRYKLSSDQVLTVWLDGSRLIAQTTGQPAIERFPEGDHKFFSKYLDSQITFEADGDRPAKAAVLHYRGQNLRAERIVE